MTKAIVNDNDRVIIKKKIYIRKLLLITNNILSPEYIRPQYLFVLHLSLYEMVRNKGSLTDRCRNMNNKLIFIVVCLKKSCNAHQFLKQFS